MKNELIKLSLHDNKGIKHELSVSIPKEEFPINDFQLFADKYLKLAMMMISTSYCLANNIDGKVVGLPND